MTRALTCTNSKCGCSPQKTGELIRYGTFRRKEDGRRIQRYRCRLCGKTSSSSTRSSAFRQQKRRINKEVLGLLCLKVSLRGIARHLGISPRTVDRRLVYWGEIARRYFQNLAVRNLHHVHFDELQSSVITKCKPVAIPIAVCALTRMILALEVASMPAQHPLVHIAMRKYGPRADDRPGAIDRVLRRIRPMMRPDAQITTDMAPRYPEPIRRILPTARHDVHRSRKARTGGQGELKKVGFDPLFSLNHTAAMIRDGVGRLVRKTWGNSKRQDRLEAHLLIYAKFHNENRLKQLPEGVASLVARNLNSVEVGC